jgi:transposase
MRYELSDFEWAAIRSFLPNKPVAYPCRRSTRAERYPLGLALRRSWRDLPGPSTTCYNRFVRWRQAGVWDRIKGRLAAGHDAAMQMICVLMSPRPRQYESRFAGYATAARSFSE